MRKILLNAFKKTVKQIISSRKVQCVLKNLTETFFTDKIQTIWNTYIMLTLHADIWNDIKCLNV